MLTRAPNAEAPGPATTITSPAAPATLLPLPMRTSPDERESVSPLVREITPEENPAALLTATLPLDDIADELDPLSIDISPPAADAPLPEDMRVLPPETPSPLLRLIPPPIPTPEPTATEKCPASPLAVPVEMAILPLSPAP